MKELVIKNPSRTYRPLSKYSYKLQMRVLQRCHSSSQKILFDPEKRLLKDLLQEVVIAPCTCNKDD